LGLIYYDLGRLEDALAPLEAALAQNPNLAETTVNTGEAEPVPFTELLKQVRQGR
jgi:tetratricopeptide (TPR) repeat protein